jgi:hypothetical protein
VATNAGTTSAEFGATVTAGGTAGVKGSWVQLSAAAPAGVCAIVVAIANVNIVATTNVRFLVDIAIGANQERTLIANLTAGNASAWNTGSPGPAMFWFPLTVPAGAPLYARASSSTASKTAQVAVWFIRGSAWAGSIVTTYGVNETNINGTSVPQGANVYGTTTQITAATTRPIRALQLGTDLLTDTTGNNKRGLVRIGAGSGPAWIVSDLPFFESTTTENPYAMSANLILAGMRFSLPAGLALSLATMVSGSAENRGWAIYGVS